MRAAIYCRVSSAGQEDNHSLPTQEAGCRRYAEERGWTVVAVYADVHTGVELFERPQLTLLREAMRRGAFDVLLVHALDRLSRKQTHQGLILTEAEHAGVKWDSATEDIDDSPQGQILRAVIGGMAEMERLKILERTMRGTRARAESGKLLAGCRPLYGYRWRDEDKSALELDRATAPVVRRIFDDFLAGKSLRVLARELSADGIPTPTGKGSVWGVSTIAAVLANSSYAGEAFAYRFRQEREKRGAVRVTKRPVEEQVALPSGTIPAIVSRSEHEAVLARLAYNRSVSARNNKEPEATLLRAGIARCGYCDGALPVKRPRSGNGRRLIYCCNGTARDRHGCPGVSVSAEVLDLAVWEQVADVLTRPEIIAAEVERRRDHSNADNNLALIDQRLRTIDRQRQNLVRAIALLEDDEDAVSLMTKELTALGGQRRQLGAERDLKAAQAADEASETRKLNDLAAWCARTADNIAGLNYGERRMVLEALGVGVRVWQTGHDPRWEITMAPLPVGNEPQVVSTTGCGSTGHWSPLGARSRSSRGSMSGSWPATDACGRSPVSST